MQKQLFPDTRGEKGRKKGGEGRREGGGVKKRRKKEDGEGEKEESKTWLENSGLCMQSA